MKKLLVFVGESGSGKTTLIAELVKKYPNKFKKIVTYTSRPLRIGEVDGRDYHFFPTEYFIDNRDLVLVKKLDGGNYYGTRKTDLYSSTHHLLLTSKITGIPKLVSLGLKNIIAARISINKELKVARMRQRGDTEKMISDCLRSDIASESDVNLEGILVIDLDASHPVDEEIEIIMKHVNG